MLANITKRFLSAFFAFVLIIIACPLNKVSAITSANGYITIFDQNSSTYKGSDYYLRDGTYVDVGWYKGPDCLTQGGCCLFAYAHAIQWLTGQKLGNQLLKDLINVCCAPSNNHGHNYSKCKNSKYEHSNSNSFNAYNAYLEDKYKLRANGGPYIKEMSETSIQSFFNGGFIIVGAISWSGGGHIILAVDYVVASDGKTYIQIIDSSSQSSTKSGRPFYDNAYSYNTTTHAVTKYKNSLSGGQQYWVPWTIFKSKFSSRAKMWGGVWQGHIDDRIAPEAIQLDRTSIDLNLTETYSLNAEVFPDNANKNLIWTSSDDTIATVSNTGVVTPLQAGKQVTITASSALDSNIFATCDINIYYQSDGTETLAFNEILCPRQYNYNDNGYNWWWSNGSISSDVNITNLEIKIYNSSGSRVSYTQVAPNAKDVHINAYSDSIKMSALKSSGIAMMEINASDVMGRSLSVAGYINVVSSGETDRTRTLSRTYQYPQLIASTVSNGKKYEIYESSSTWTEARDYATSIGGYLACITSEQENTAIRELAETAGADNTWIGEYYDGTSYVWVSGASMAYTHWDSGEPSRTSNLQHYAYMRSSGLWDDAYNASIINYMVVEYPMKAVEQIFMHGETAPFVGDTFTVTATVLPSDATDPSVVFSSSDPSIVTIDAATGEAVAVSEGAATITAAAQDGSAVSTSLNVYVQRLPIRVTDIEIYANGIYTDTNTVTMNEGETVIVYCSVSPSDADNKGTYFYSTNSDIAYVDDYTDTVIASNAGTCEIVAVSDDNETITDRLTVVVKPKLDVLTDPDFVLPAALQTIEEEAFAEIPAALIKLPEGIKTIGSRAFADCVELTQIFIPESVTSISADAFDGCGKFTIVGYQNTAAQTFADSHEEISFLALDASAPTGITAMEIVGGGTIDVNETITLSVEIEPADIPDRTVTWTSSNNNVATVDSSGHVTGVSGGTALITAISNYDSAYSTFALITVNPVTVEPTESDWVLASEVPEGAEITQTSWSYRENIETTVSSLSGWIADGGYWSEVGSGSTNYATFPSGYKTSNTYYTTFAKAPYTASNDGNTKRVVVNTKAGYIYWHWMYSTVYASGTERRISSKTGYYNASGASGSGSDYYGYLYFYAMASTVDCPYLSNGYCCGQNLPSYNCKSIIPSDADKSNTSGLGTDRFFRFEYYTSTYTDYQMIYEYHRDLEFQSSDPGEGDNISNKVMYAKYIIE